jgi:thymidylate synthase (FAD)
MTQNIVKPDINIISFNEKCVEKMFITARNCYHKGDITKLICDNPLPLLKKIYNNGHLSIFEQSYIQYYLRNVSRSFTMQLTRQRIGWSYAIQSQHYQKMNDFDFKELEYYPNDSFRDKYIKLMSDINILYNDLMNNNCPRHIAREVLPNSCSVNIVCSTNLRALFHFFDIRNGKENTLEMILVSNIMREKLYEKDIRLKEIYESK